MPKNLLKPLAAALALSFAAAAAAHDVWMESDRFVVPVGTALPYRVFVGHAAAREPWDVAVSRVVSLRSVSAGGVVILSPARAEGGTIRFSRPGTYVVALESSHAKSDLPSLRFNDYAKEEGLTPILALRERLGQTARNGRELYSRRTKMLVKVGESRAAHSHLLRPLGLTLEIVPGRDPFTVAAGSTLPLRIWYNGKPLVGATVKLNNLDADAKPIAQALSNAGGVVLFKHPGRGRWQANVVWSRPLIGNSEAEFETVFSSLTFGS